MVYMKSGSKLGIIVGIIQGISTILLINLVTDVLYYRGNIFVLFIISIIGGIFGGYIVGHIYEMKYNSLPGSTNITKGIAVSPIFWILSWLLFAILVDLIGYMHVWVAMTLMGLIFSIVWGILIGYLWNKFDFKSEISKSKSVVKKSTEPSQNPATKTSVDSQQKTSDINKNKMLRPSGPPLGIQTQDISAKGKIKGIIEGVARSKSTEERYGRKVTQRFNLEINDSEGNPLRVVPVQYFYKKKIGDFSNGDFLQVKGKMKRGTGIFIAKKIINETQKTRIKW